MARLVGVKRAVAGISALAEKVSARRLNIGKLSAYL